MRQKRKFILVNYWANPNLPNKRCHKGKPDDLIMKRGRKFAISQYKEAWEFLESCVNAITTLENILWAFPQEEAIEILEILREDENQLVVEHEQLTAAQYAIVDEDDVYSTLK